MLSSARFGAVVVLSWAAVLSGCSHDYGTLGGGGATGGCPTGSETCACFPDDTCQAGLSCTSNLCVRPGGTGTGGGVGPGGSVGAAGSIGLGGSVGAAGSSGAGGSGGAAGSIGRGGSVGAAGSVVTGSGGSVGSGGAGGLGPPANNQILNGDFNSGSSAPWHVTASTDATSVVTNGQFCVTEPTAYTSFNIGWPTTSPPAAALLASTTYEFYFQISTTAPLYTFTVKVGSAPVQGSSANLTDFMSTDLHTQLTAGAGLQTFAYTFVPGADPTAGVVFLLYSAASPTTVCIDNVALGTPN